MEEFIAWHTTRVLRRTGRAPAPWTLRSPVQGFVPRSVARERMSWVFWQHDSRTGVQPMRYSKICPLTNSPG